MTSTAPSSTPSAAPPKRRVPRWRRILVGFLVVVGCVLAPVSIIGVWVHNTLLDTDQWVDTVGPLVEELRGDGLVAGFGPEPRDGLGRVRQDQTPAPVVLHDARAAQLREQLGGVELGHLYGLPPTGAPDQGRP